MNDITNDTPVPDGAYRINLEAWTESDGKRLKVGTSIEHRKDGDSPERIVMEKVIDLEDAAIREGLQALGWIAPKPVDEAIARLNASLQPQPQIEASATMRDALIAQGWVPPGELKAPPGYALICVEALKDWGRFDEVNEACGYALEPKSDAQASLPLVPGPVDLGRLGTTGPCESCKYSDLTPDDFPCNSCVTPGHPCRWESKK